MFDNLDLLQEEPKASHHKPEPHQGQARANPCKQSSLSRQVVAESSILSGSCRLLHLSVSRKFFRCETRQTPPAYLPSYRSFKIIESAPHGQDQAEHS